jgi:asparagine N-glycosylation enzyme membrane subunit Stt3
MMEKRPFTTSILRSLFCFLGATLPLAAICFYSYRSGVWEKFRFWTFDYAREYVSEIPLELGMKHFVLNSIDIVKPSLFLWALAAVGLLSLVFRKRFKDDRFFLLSFFVLSIFAISPGFYFRKHYYVMLLPSISLFIGISIQDMKFFFDKRKSRAAAGMLPFVILICAITHSFYENNDILFFGAPEYVSRKLYGSNPFVESLPVAKYIEANTSSNDRILVLGSEPQIYFYSKRLSATGHIYMYGLMEQQKYARTMQEEMIREVVNADPKVIVVVTTMTSWLVGPDSDTTILDWANRYLAENFAVVGIADIIGPDTTIFLWDKDAERYVPRSNSVVYIYKKRWI